MGDAAAVGTMGSSPLARGLPPRTPRPGSTPGIIPARAGFTSRPTARAPATADHPRSRGVYRSFRRPGRPKRGSSPLARGLRRRPDPSATPEGIIPARAGFTRGGHRPGPGRWDHPRSRGVYSDERTRGLYDEGSSPLARGLLAAQKSLTGLLRIIPARAGFTTKATRRRCPLWDHPRSRGVYLRDLGQRSPGLGSSPLARGLPTERESDSARPGIIPARAGFTAPARRGAGGVRVGRDHPRSRGVYGRGYPRVL